MLFHVVPHWAQFQISGNPAKSEVILIPNVVKTKFYSLLR